MTGPTCPCGTTAPEGNAPPGWDRPWACWACLHGRAAAAHLEAGEATAAWRAVRGELGERTALARGRAA